MFKKWRLVREETQRWDLFLFTKQWERERNKEDCVVSCERNGFFFSFLPLDLLYLLRSRVYTYSFIQI